MAKIEMIGHKKETLLAEILSEPLLLDFVHLRPQYHKNGETKEFSDLLIEDEPTAIVVQLKSQDLKSAKPGRDSKKWARKRLRKASDQVVGSIKRLQLSDILVKSPSRGEIVFMKKSLECKHGIVIIDYKDDPFVLDESLPRRSTESSTIHYFSHDNFITLCQQLKTLPDLIEYLNERTKIPAWATPKLNNEKDTYAYYCTHKGKFNSTLELDDFNGEWERLTVEYNDYYQEKIREDKLAEIFTHILMEMQLIDPIAIHDHPDYVTTVINKEDLLRVKTTRLLNRLRRLPRREIIKKYVEKMKLADDSPQR